MKRILATLLAIGLVGCGGGQAYVPADPVTAQCQYEAEVAIQNIPNPLYAGYRRSELFNMCMRGRGR